MDYIPTPVILSKAKNPYPRPLAFPPRGRLCWGAFLAFPLGGRWRRASHESPVTDEGCCGFALLPVAHDVRRYRVRRGRTAGCRPYRCGAGRGTRPLWVRCMLRAANGRPYELRAIRETGSFQFFLRHRYARGVGDAAPYSGRGRH